MDWITGMYLVMFLAGLVFVVASFLLGGVGDTDVSGGMDVDAGGLDVGGHDVGASGGDASGGHDGASGSVGLSPISPLMLSMSIAIFGAFGLVLEGTSADWLGHGMILFLSIMLTFGIGAAIFVAISKLFVQTQASSTYSPSDAVGLMARVTTPIPKGKTGVIDYVIAGERVSSSAQSDDDCKFGDTVRIKKVIGTVMFVEKAKE